VGFCEGEGRGEGVGDSVGLGGLVGGVGGGVVERGVVDLVGDETGVPAASAGGAAPTMRREPRAKPERARARLGRDVPGKNTGTG
jgi:hypothetical protein